MMNISTDFHIPWRYLYYQKHLFPFMVFYQVAYGKSIKKSIQKYKRNS